MVELDTYDTYLEFDMFKILVSRHFDSWTVSA